MLGLQLFHSANEKDESEFPYRKSHGHSFRQYEVTNTGNMTHDLSSSSCLSQRCDLSVLLMPSVTSWVLNIKGFFFFQILDSELFELMHQNGDYTHFYFCYRWFLLDFKRGEVSFRHWNGACVLSNTVRMLYLRLYLHWLTSCVSGVSVSELLYEDVFAVWEVIWVAPHISSKHFVLFIALALVEVYRDIILDNNMDFTDIIKFFNGESTEQRTPLKLKWLFSDFPNTLPAFHRLNKMNSSTPNTHHWLSHLPPLATVQK